MRLEHDGVLYLPVRHHSPACARRVGAVIRSQSPRSVLIEGPRDAGPLLDWLAHPETVAPVALYSFVRSKGFKSAAYYPMADTSPELEALRAAREVGARVEFIDLTLAELTRSESRAVGGLRSRLEESYLAHSQRLQRAALKVGARDADDLWDHLFETGEQPWEDFFLAVLAYCEEARRDYTPEMLKAEGHPARERVMAGCIAAAERPAVVVTGGFHTVALPSAKPGKPPTVPRGVTCETFLIRYGFEQLDRLNGYASGLPLPGYYQDLWDGRDPAHRLVEVGRALRQQGISAADEIEAVRQMRGLASFRGHRLPSREDVLDAVRSVYIKGTDDVEGVLVLAEAIKQLAGRRLGKLPPGVATPPLVVDFAVMAGALSLPVETAEPKELSLDLYRTASHRQVSRFLHRLNFLDVPYGVCVGGPDFARGHATDLVHERWHVAWHPGTEAALVERSAYGASLEEACSEALRERVSQLPDRHSSGAARLLVEAARMGLHQHLCGLLGETSQRLAEDPSLVSTVETLTHLLLLREGREPLEAGELPELSELIRVSYRRACFLLPTPDADEARVLQALKTLEQGSLRVEEPGLRFAGLEELSRAPSMLLRGAATGLLFAAGRMGEAALAASASGALLGQGAVDFLRGLLATARSVLWQVPALIEALHRQLSSYTEEEFLERLPALRLAFSELIPDECDRVALQIVRTTGQPLSLELAYTPEQLALARRAEEAVREELERDGII